MARVLPDPLVGTFPAEVLRVYRALKAIPGDDFMVWAGLPLNENSERPDFLVVHANSTAFAIVVSDATKVEVDERMNGSLFTILASKPEVPSGIEGLGFIEWRRVNAFINTTRLPEEATYETDRGWPAVYGFVVFPNVPHETLRHAWAENPVDGSYWLGCEYVTSERLAASLRKLSTGGLAERQLATLRSRFSPETVVPQRFAARARMKRNVEAGTVPLLLDYEQEAWAKNRLRLPDGATELAEVRRLTAKRHSLPVWLGAASHWCCCSAPVRRRVWTLRAALS